MAISLRASKQGLEIVEAKRKNKGWGATAVAWYSAANTSEATLKRFRRGIPIDRDVFIAICKAVGIDNWEEIIDNTSKEQQQKRAVKSLEERSLVELNNKGYYLPLEQRDSRQELLPVGREKDIEYLSQLVNSGNKVIIIQGIGGVGKTTLAKSFFQFRGLKYLELIIARETRSIKPIEDAIDALLPELEEPSRNFRGKLQQLKLQLQTRKFGILIDNLEPALDKHGKFIEPHRDYL